MENQQYLQAFLDESVENTQTLNTLCLELEQGKKDDDIFAAMFRAAHTLKGMSATMGFTKMAALTHKLEDALGVVRESPELLTGELVDQFFLCIDGLSENLKDIRSNGGESNINHDELVQKLQSLVSVNLKTEEAQAKLRKGNSDGSELALCENALNVIELCQASGVETGILKVAVDPNCVMKGVRSVVIMRTIDEYADCLQCDPDAESMEQGLYESVIQFVVAFQHGTSNQLVKAVENISEVMHVSFSSIHFNAFHETAASSPPIPQRNELKKPSNKVNEHPEKMDRTIRVSTHRLDTLMNQLSELVIDKTRLNAVSNRLDSNELKELSDHISRIATDIQASVMSLRMVQVESLFQRFPRMVRDLSKTLDKKIHLEMSGLTTELDRTVIDEMGEALVHLIRNAADHGLESAEVRIQNGKPEEGTIFLRAYASGQHVFIEVADDGGGINTDQILQKAVKNGLVTQDKVLLLSDKQIMSLLFESGFSTAEIVSDISGRGVGLDAVKRKVESLGGTIDIESDIGKGTTFRIELPLTLAIIQSLLVEIDNETFAIPLSSVEEVIMADDSVLERVHGTITLNLRGKLVPIIDASKWLFGIPSCKELPCNLVVCIEGTKRIAIGVDSFHGQQEIVNKSLGSYLSNVREFSGATILGDGSIALILNVHEWINL